MFSSTPAQAQLSNTFGEMFDYFLINQLALNDQNGVHGTHFLPAAREVEQVLAPSLNALIASNISSFPLSSTIAGVSLDFSSGRAVITNESLGPIFAETASTIGPGKISIGLNYSYLNLNRFRGMDVDAMRFTFIHQDSTPFFPFEEEPEGSESLGNPTTELDNMDVFPNLDINSNIFAFTLTAGVTKNLDISLAIPIINTSLSGTAQAVINSFTYGRPGNPETEGAAHRFGGTLLNPDLVTDTTYSVSSNGLGDIAIRLKYVFAQTSSVNMAAMVDVRLPTGDEENFLGTGSTNTRVLWIMSSSFGDFNPHLNIGYDNRGGDFDSNEIEYIIGFEQKLSNAFTFAIDLLGTYDLDDGQTIELFPGATSIPESFQGGTAVRTFQLSNIPDFTRDNTLDLSVGMRVAPSDKIVLMGNILAPLDDGGLRSTVTPTIGLSISI